MNTDDTDLGDPGPCFFAPTETVEKERPRKTRITRKEEGRPGSLRLGLDGQRLEHIAMRGTQETIIEFRVTGFPEPPSEALRQLRVKASDRWSAGDSKAPNTILKHEENGFRVRATRQVVDFEERVRRLVEKIYPFRRQLAELRADCQLACIFYLSGSERPVVFFSKEVLGQLAELAASIDVDMYYLGEETD